MVGWMIKRLLLGFGANAFGQAVTIAIQVSSLPIFLIYWDTAKYGTWILLSAIPSYLIMADVGMVSVAGNKMMMAMARNDLDDANEIFQTAQLFLTIVCTVLLVLIIPVTLLGPMPSYMTWDNRLALTALMCAVLIVIYGGLSEAVFKATDRYPEGTLLGQVSRLAEWAGYIVGLALFGSLSGVACVGLLGRILSGCAMIVLAQRGGRGLKLGYSKASWLELRRMAHPALSFMAFPLANALSFQGVTFVVGALAGTSAVAVFTVYRTVARVAVQLISIFSLALWPEFSRLFGAGESTAVTALYKRSAMIASLSAMALSFAVYAISPWLLQFWTHGRIPFIPPVMAWLLAYAAIGGAAFVPRTILLATNQHVGLAGWSLAVAALSVALAWTMGKFGGLLGVSVAMFGSELLIAAICFWIADRVFVNPDRRQKHSIAVR
jgi:O-antigen/teichoic acid export membrane protein